MAVTSGDGLEDSGATLPTSLSLFNAVEGTSCPECFWKHLALDSHCSPHCKLCGDPPAITALRQWLSGI